MKIMDNRPKERTITLNYIPVGQVFRGTIHGKLRETKGIFLKVFDNWSYDGQPREVMVVQLDADPFQRTYGPLWSTCRPVENYEPLDAELVIKGSSSL